MHSKSRLSQTTVLVTGATGTIGPFVVQELVNSGYAVRTLSLEIPEPGLFHKDVEVITGDITDPQTVQSAMQDIEVVIHLAAVLHVSNPPSAFLANYYRVNREGTATVISASLQAGVERIVFFSTIAVYGLSGGRILTEDTFPRPDTCYAETKLAAERLVLNAKRPDGGPLGTVLRLGAVYGSRIKGDYQRLLRALAQRRFVPIGSGQNRRTLVYARDVARATILAIRHPKAVGRVYNVSDGKYHAMHEIIAAMSLALGRTPSRYSLPAGPIRFAAGLIEDAARFVRCQSPIGRATIDKYTEDVAASSQRIQTEIGFVPQYDLASGWLEAVREMRYAGIL